MMQPILTTEEVAELLKCSTRTVEDHARSGRIPGAKFGDGWVFAADLVVEAVKRISLEEAKRRAPAPEPEKKAAGADVVGVIKPAPKKGRTLPGLSLLPQHAVSQILASQ